jgi:hypothetical protein
VDNHEAGTLSLAGAAAEMPDPMTILLEPGKIAIRFN